MKNIKGFRLFLFIIMSVVGVNVFGQSIELSITQDINVFADERDKTFEVLSDVDWTVSIEYPNGHPTGWLTVKQNQSGLASADPVTVTLHYTENTSATSREAIVKVSGGDAMRCFKITQLKKELSLDISLTVITFNQDGGSKTFDVASNVTWSATCDETWLTVSGGTGTGNGTVTLTPGAYSGAQPRTATVTVSGQGLTKTVSVTQLGDQLSLEVTPTSVYFDKNGGSKTFDVASNVTWSATCDETWLTVSGGTGTGNGTVTLTTGACTGAQFRTATVTVSGQGLTKTVRASQGGSCQLSLEVTPTSVSFNKDGGSKTFDVASNVTWTATCAANWLTLSGGNGTGNGIVTLTAGAYTGAQSRTAVITVTGGGIAKYVYITQAASTESSDRIDATSTETPIQAIYSISGVRTTELKKGLNIIVLENGKVEKIYKK